MSDRADELRRQADAMDDEDRLAAVMNAALELYRWAADDTTKANYRAAVQALADYRQAARADRTGLTVVAEVN